MLNYFFCMKIKGFVKKSYNNLKLCYNYYAQLLQCNKI